MTQFGFTVSALKEEDTVHRALLQPKAFLSLSFSSMRTIEEKRRSMSL
jgi:hypothetical protein